MRIVRAADWTMMPWRNGGGLTAEIAVDPPGAGFDDFVWRLSAARVEQPGPFSVLPGVDRTLGILEGNGLSLRVGEGAWTRLAPDSAPYAFAADIPVASDLPDGAILDLNLMTRRTRATHVMTRMEIMGTLRQWWAADTLLVHARNTITLRQGEETARLETGDTAILSAPAVLALQAERGATVFVAAISVA